MDNNYMKFPIVLRENIEKGEVVFPKNIQYEYSPILGFRGIERALNDFTAVSRKDFLSYAELNVSRRGIKKKTPIIMEFHCLLTRNL